MKSKRIWKIAGINFDHFHMGDLLRMAARHPRAEIVGICDDQPARMAGAAQDCSIPSDRIFTDVRLCLEKTKPDFVILCPAAARHAKYVERIAPYGIHMLVEKPFAGSLLEADRMIAAAREHRVRLAINWPSRWSPVHSTAYKVLMEGRVGNLQEVHYYGGNRGPLRHGSNKIETNPGPKSKSWFYQRKAGGGSMLDYLGYGATLGTWFHKGARPLEVISIQLLPEGLEVDEHSITVARYHSGLSKFETRWGTFSDPWTHQPQPACGFVLKGDAGTIASYDYSPTLRIQTEQKPGGFDLPVRKPKPPFVNAIQYFIHCLETGGPFEGPLSLETSRIGQQIIDTAMLSARKGRVMPLIES